MPTTSIAQARKDAHTICSKGECSIVQKSNPEELGHLTPAQIRNQIKLSERYFKKHQENYKRVGGGHRKSPEGISEQHHIKLKMSIMEDARKRFEKQLKAASKKTPKIKAAAKKSRITKSGVKRAQSQAGSRLKGPSSATRSSRLNT